MSYSDVDVMCKQAFSQHIDYYTSFSCASAFLLPRPRLRQLARDRQKYQSLHSRHTDNFESLLDADVEQISHLLFSESSAIARSFTEEIS